MTDAFRGPLHEVFKLLEIVNNHEDEKLVTLSKVCLHVENVKRRTQQSIFPEYNCLTLSPANFWQQNPYEFNKDSNLLNTIFHYHNFQKSKVSTAEILFGMPLKDTGLKRYPMRVRQRTLQFAITLVLKENNHDFIKSLKKKLTDVYPLHQEDVEVNKEQDRLSLMYIYYPSEFNLFEFGPLCVAFGLVFLYVYMTVRKIEVIRSRIILAMASCITVMGSLIMSLGFCFFFGLTISTQSKGVYPYLVLLVGLENSLVLTKSVLSTDEKLDVKIRLAQGLNKEGWSITKNLLTEITILTIGLATFVPVIQEFCIFAIVGLISDFFLQMLFFSTILTLDIKRVEYVTEAKHFPKMLSGGLYNNATRNERNSFNNFYRSRSHPKLTGLETIQKKAESEKKRVPKRLKIVHFWARTRFFQRGFMVWMVLWISNIIYNSGLIEKLFIIDRRNVTGQVEGMYRPGSDFNSPQERYEFPRNFFENRKREEELSLLQNSAANVTEQLAKLRHPEYDMNFRLSNFHWSTILKQYNISMSGRYVTVLPTIRLSHPVAPDVAIHIRNPLEKLPQHFQWKTLAVALDPLDFNDADSQDIPNYSFGSTPLYPKTPMEMILASILAIISVIVLIYSLIVIYRCICSRNYAEWRASWSDKEEQEEKTEHVLDGVAVQVNGHRHVVECVVTDGHLIASSCLESQVKIWDANNGSLITSINRQKYFDENPQEVSKRNSFYQHSSSSGSLSASPPQNGEHYHSFSPTTMTAANPINRKMARLSLDGCDLQFKQLRGMSPPAPQIKVPNRRRNEKLSPIRHGFTYLFSMKWNGSATEPLIQNPSLRPNFLRAGSHNLTASEVDSMNNSAISGICLTSNAPPIWCLDFQDNLIVLGCADGRLEFWEGTTGNFKVNFVESLSKVLVSL